MVKSFKTADWAESHGHLSRQDPVLKQILRDIAPCPLRPQRDYFAFLCRSIYSQQISTIVARKLFSSFRDAFPRRRPTPELTRKILLHPDPATHPRGLSRQKKKYLIDLAEHFIEGRIPSRRLSRMSDEEVIEALVNVNGIGRWSAEMFLIFVLNRPDVLPVDDLGVRIGVEKAYKLKARPTAQEVREIAQSWRPHATLGTWAMWRFLEASRSAPKVKAKRSPARSKGRKSA